MRSKVTWCTVMKRIIQFDLPFFCRFITFCSKDTGIWVTPSCSSRRDASNDILVDLKSSLLKFDLRSRSRDVPGVTKGVMLHIIRRALTRRTYWCFLFCDIFILSIVIGKRSLGLKSVFSIKKGFFKELSGQLDKFKK